MVADIKNIIFDFGGVLVDLDKSRCIEAFKNLGFYQAEQLVDTYSQQGVFGKLEAGLITREEFCNILDKIDHHYFDYVITHTCPEAWMPTDLFMKGVDSSKISREYI